MRDDSQAQREWNGFVQLITHPEKEGFNLINVFRKVWSVKGISQASLTTDADII